MPLSVMSQQVSLVGVAHGKALIAINGGQPRFVSVGETVQGVRVLAIQRDEALLEVAGKRLEVRLGEGPLSTAATAATARAPSRQIVLLADAGGHFAAQGQINGQNVRFLVDTGATVVTLSVTQARRIGLNFASGTPVRAKTANGDITGHQIQLNSLRLGEHTSFNVAAVVLPADLPYVLLGNSFLTRFNMTREGQTMTLTPRY